MDELIKEALETIQESIDFAKKYNYPVPTEEECFPYITTKHIEVDGQKYFITAKIRKVV